jgi:Uma2 family endonuclease
MSAQRGSAYRWLADDTEESVLGADWHQKAIGNLGNGLREVAEAQGWPWHVGTQQTLVAWHPDGAVWRPLPDVMVHPQAGPQNRKEMNAHTDGLPVLIVEVASPTTYRSDVNTEAPTRQQPEAKGYEYLAWPLPEYLVFDPTEEHLVGQVRAWRVVDGRFAPWLPDGDGRYQSRTLGVSFRPEGFFLRIFDPAGQPVPFDHEQRALREQAQRRAEHEEQRAQQAEQEKADALRRTAQAEAEVAALRALLQRRHMQEDS